MKQGPRSNGSSFILISYGKNYKDTSRRNKTRKRVPCISFNQVDIVKNSNRQSGRALRWGDIRSRDGNHLSSQGRLHSESRCPHSQPALLPMGFFFFFRFKGFHTATVRAHGLTVVQGVGEETRKRKKRKAHMVVMKTTPPKTNSAK